MSLCLSHFSSQAETDFSWLKNEFMIISVYGGLKVRHREAVARAKGDPVNELQETPQTP